MAEDLEHNETQKPKFIDANLLKSRIASHSAIQTIIDKMPAADVRPERYAEWIDTDWDDDPSDCYGRCSACRKGSPHLTNFCPHCGADMRVHGHWIEDEYAYMRCSECGFEHDYPEHTTAICPCCGAVMDGDPSEH